MLLCNKVYGKYVFLAHDAYWTLPQVVHIRLDDPEPESQLRVVRVRQLKLPAEFT